MRNQPTSGLERIFMNMTTTLSSLGGAKLTLWNLEKVYSASVRVAALQTS